MASKTRKFVGELVFCGFLGGVGWLALSGLHGLTKSPFDYLGSAEVPRVLAWLLIVLAILVALNIFFSAITRPDKPAEPQTLTGRMVGEDPENGRSGTRQVWQTALMIAATLLYVLSILWSEIPYSVSTTVFLMVGMVALAPAHLRKLQIVLPLSILIGAVGEYIFVSILLLPFPGW